MNQKARAESGLFYLGIFVMFPYEFSVDFLIS